MKRNYRKYEKLRQWTLFLDMLGYSSHNERVTNEKEASEFISFMKSNKLIIDGANDLKKEGAYADGEFKLSDFYDIQHAFVSDSLIMSYVPKEIKKLKNRRFVDLHAANALFIFLMRLQEFIYNCFKEKGLFLRGGISSKFCHIDGTFAVGEGLVEAHIAESKLAKNPRVIIHPSILDDTKLMSEVKFLSDKMYSGVELLKKDEDGRFFLNYLEHAIVFADDRIEMIKGAKKAAPSIFEKNKEQIINYLEAHAHAIKVNVVKFESELANYKEGTDDYKGLFGVLSKYRWLQKYHNESVAKFPPFDKYVCSD